MHARRRKCREKVAYGRIIWCTFFLFEYSRTYALSFITQLHTVAAIFRAIAAIFCAITAISVSLRPHFCVIATMCHCGHICVIATVCHCGHFCVIATISCHCGRHFVPEWPTLPYFVPLWPLMCL
ncbi:hypothetical protein DFH06DRAFT_1234507 [Mycena polygramma]|nr:hypothetical protein DFH06DRAFT_1234507 [Mycena polygramma]